MKHIFIVNPKSGYAGNQKKLVHELNKRGLELYLTKGPGDGEKYIKEICRGNPGAGLRFYACGGDGTLNEIVNGIFGFENVEAAVIPTGSGNDFIKNFGVPLGAFKDIDRQLAGSPITVDIIKYRELSSCRPERFAVNMFNIGFDCNVVLKMGEVKKIPFVKGSFAYLLSILLTLVKKEGAGLTIEFDDGTSYSGHVLLTAIGNGAFCGGGLKGVPEAEPNDGLMDICVIKNVSRRMIVHLLPKYANGTYLQDKKVKNLIIYKKCKSLIIKNFKDSWRLCVDGEIKAAGEVKFEIAPGAIRFSLPDNSHFSSARPI